MRPWTERVILGTVQFGLPYGINNQKGQVSFDEVEKILLAAWDAGLRKLDTADGYGNACDVIGDFHKKHPHRRFKILTKFKNLDSVNAIQKHIESSLDRLHISELECDSFHSFADFQNFKDFHGLAAIREQKKVKQWGVSVYHPEEAIQVLKNPLIQTLQIPYNVLDNINFWGPILKKAQDEGKQIHARSLFLQGLFFKSIQQIQTDVPYLERLTPYISKIHQISEKYQLSLTSLLLGYGLKSPGIDSIVIGVDSFQHFDKNIQDLKQSQNLQQLDEIHQLQVENRDLLNPAKWPALKSP